MTRLINGTVGDHEPWPPVSRSACDLELVRVDEDRFCPRTERAVLR